MESTDKYNFSIFRPRNKHGRKNRNVILTMLTIWAVAVFGFQTLLRISEKPTAEPALNVFESSWSALREGNEKEADATGLLKSIVQVTGKTTVTPGDLKTLKSAITALTYKLVPDSTRNELSRMAAEANVLRAQLASLKGADYLAQSVRIKGIYDTMSGMVEEFTGLKKESLESALLVHGITSDYSAGLDDPSLIRLPEIMKLYLTHNQSIFTDAKFLGFPFHYFYTGVLLLILFIFLCITYNMLIEWRLKKEGIVE